jgi:hypothetical protein
LFCTQAIIPQGNTLSLNDLIADIKRRESSIPIPPKNYIFANNYFFFDYTPVVSIAPPAIKDVREFLASELTVLKFQRKAPLSPYGYSVKSIIDPQACLQMHNHYCWSLTPQFVGGPLTYVVDSSLGLNQHYKYCHLNSTECDVLNQRSTTDTTMFKYRQRLVENVASKLAAVFGDSTSVIARLL